MPTFSKNERLCSHIQIQELLKSKSSFYVYPFKCIYLKTSDSAGTIQIAFSVPKKKLKFAHQRNTVRRRIRESYRLNKSALLEYLNLENCSLSCLLIYTESQILSYTQIDEKIKTVLLLIQKQLFVTLEQQSKNNDFIEIES